MIELPGEIDKPTIIVGDFSTPLSEIDISSRQKIRGKQVNATTPTTGYN